MDKEPQVGIVLGSASDGALGQEITKVLTSFEVSFELVVASAHRTPQKASLYAKEAAGRGIKVLIAVAGLAAHLPGVLAADTVLPVIGVPAAGSGYFGSLQPKPGSAVTVVSPGSGSPGRGGGAGSIAGIVILGQMFPTIMLFICLPVFCSLL